MSGHWMKSYHHYEIEQDHIGHRDESATGFGLLEIFIPETNHPTLNINLKRKMEIWSSRAKYCNYGEWMPQSRRFLFTQKVS
jgi:hypothetical protein